MTARDFTLRPYRPADEEAALALWLRSWQAAYPEIDFASRLAWWRERWRTLLVPHATIIVAEEDSGLTGFVTVDPTNGYLDQFVVTPEAWGSRAGARLIAEAKAIAPAGLDLHVNQDNARALRFYGKHGFTIAGNDVNAQSGRPTYLMRWRP